MHIKNHSTFRSAFYLIKSLIHRISPLHVRATGRKSRLIYRNVGASILSQSGALILSCFDIFWWKNWRGTARRPENSMGYNSIECQECGDYVSSKNDVDRNSYGVKLDLISFWIGLLSTSTARTMPVKPRLSAPE